MIPTARSRVRILAVALPLVAALALVVLDVRGVLERPTLLRAGFTVAAGLVALALFAAPERDGDAATRFEPPVLTTTKVVLALCGGAVVATAQVDSRLVPFAVVLPVGAALVALQIRGDPSVPAVLTQLCALFLAPRLGKYLTTGFYFGGTDTFAHVGAVERLFAAGYTPAIPHGYDLYPVYHFLVGTVSAFSRLATYDALVLTGVGAMTVAVPLAYLVGASVFDSPRLGLTTALAATVLEFVAYHALYFFPQALATLLVLVGVYVTSRLGDPTDERSYRQYTVFALALVVTMVFTHHLTYFLFAGVLALSVPVVFVRSAVFDDSPADALEMMRFRRLVPLFVGGALLLAYWTYSPSTIVLGIVALSAGVFVDVVTTAGSQLYTYGTTLPADSVALAVTWLRTPTGVYAAALGAVLLVAGYAVLDRPQRYRRGFTLTVTGLAVAGVLLPLPVAIPQVERLRFVVTVLALFPVSVGLHRALSAGGRYAAVAVVLVATLGGATAFTVVVADDVDAVYTGEVGEQSSMTAAEYRSTQRSVAFLQSSVAGPAATDTVTERAFESVRYDPGGELVARPAGLRTNATALVVRERWPDHVVALGSGVRAVDSDRFALSRARFATGEATVDAVYSAGQTRIYYRAGGFRGLYGDGQ